jgi:hypothetical protein
VVVCSRCSRVCSVSLTCIASAAATARLASRAHVSSERAKLTCGGPQNLAPVYEQLGDAFAHAKGKVLIAKTDADGVGKPLGAKYEVKGFPSASVCCGLTSVDAEGGRSTQVVLRGRQRAGGVRRWPRSRCARELVRRRVCMLERTYADNPRSSITKKTGVKSNIKPPPPPATKILSVDTFKGVALVRHPVWYGFHSAKRARRTTRRTSWSPSPRRGAVTARP